MDIKNVNQNLVNNRLSDPSKNQERAEKLTSGVGTNDSVKNTDKVTLTNVSTQVKDLEKKVSGQKIDNSARIAELKGSIQDGSYQVNAKNVAQKLIQTEALFAQA